MKYYHCQDKEKLNIPSMFQERLDRLETVYGNYCFVLDLDKNKEIETFDLCKKDNFEYVLENLISDYENGKLPLELEKWFKSIIDNCDNEKQIYEQIYKSFNPPDLVNWQNGWELNSIYEWIFDLLYVNFVILCNGGILLDDENVKIEKIKLDGD